MIPTTISRLSPRHRRLRDPALPLPDWVGFLPNPIGMAPVPASARLPGRLAPVTAELCLACMRYHPPPQCDHDATLLCQFCLKPRGYRWSEADGEAAGRANQCWWCWRGKETADARQRDPQTD